MGIKYIRFDLSDGYGFPKSFRRIAGGKRGEAKAENFLQKFSWKKVRASEYKDTELIALFKTIIFYAKMQKLRKNLGEEILIILGGFLGAILFLAIVGLATYLLTRLKKSAFSF